MLWLCLTLALAGAPAAAAAPAGQSSELERRAQAVLVIEAAADDQADPLGDPPDQPLLPIAAPAAPPPAAAIISSDRGAPQLPAGRSSPFHARAPPAA